MERRRTPMSTFVIEFFPDGYDVYGLVYLSDTDSENEYLDEDEEDEELICYTGDKSRERVEDTWSPSSIGLYLSSPREDGENVDDNHKRRKKKKSRKSSKTKKKSSSQKRISMSDSALLKPSLKSITRKRLRKKRFFSLNNKTKESWSLKRKRSSSEGEHIVKKKPKEMPENGDANSSKRFEKDKPIFQNKVSKCMVHEQPSPIKMENYERKHESCPEESAAMSVDNLSDDQAKNVSVKENSEVLQSVQLSSETAAKVTQEKPKEMPVNGEANSPERLERDKPIFQNNASEGMVHEQPYPMKMESYEKKYASCPEESASMSVDNLSDEAKNVSVKENSEVLQSVQLSSETATKVTQEKPKRQKKPKEMPVNGEANSPERLERDKPTFQNNASEGMVHEQPSTMKMESYEKKRASCPEESDAMSVDNLSDEAKNVSVKGNSEILQSVHLSSEETAKVTQEKSKRQKKPKEMPETGEANSPERLEKGKPIFQNKASEGMVHEQPSTMKMESYEKKHASCPEESDSMSVDNLSGEAKNVSVKGNSEILQCNPLSTKEAAKVTQEQLSEKVSNEDSSRKNTKIDSRSHKEVSEESSGTLADDESDHDEEKINFRNNSFVENYKKISSTDNTSEGVVGNASSPEEAGTSSAKKIPKNDSNIPLRRNLKEKLFKEKCKEDSEYPSKETDLRNHLHQTLSKKPKKKRKRSRKRPSMKTIPEEKSYGNPGTSAKYNGTKKRKNKKFKKACIRRKLKKLFEDCFIIRYEMIRPNLHGEEEKDQTANQVVNLSSLPVDEYYIDNFECSDIVGAEACIGNEDEIIPEINDESVGKMSSENQSSNNHISENQSSNNQIPENQSSNDQISENQSRDNVCDCIDCICTDSNCISEY